MTKCQCCEMDELPIVDDGLCTYCYYDPECEIVSNSSSLLSFLNNITFSFLKSFLYFYHNIFLRH